MSAIITAISADIMCLDCPMRDFGDNCLVQEHSGATWEEMKEDCPLKSVEGLIEKIENSCCVTVGRQCDPAITLRDVKRIIKDYCKMEGRNEK